MIPKAVKETFIDKNEPIPPIFTKTLETLIPELVNKLFDEGNEPIPPIVTKTLETLIPELVNKLFDEGNVLPIINNSSTVILLDKSSPITLEFKKTLDGLNELVSQKFNQTLEGWNQTIPTRFNQTLEGWNQTIPTRFNQTLEGWNQTIPTRFNQMLEGWNQTIPIVIKQILDGFESQITNMSLTIAKINGLLNSNFTTTDGGNDFTTTDGGNDFTTTKDNLIAEAGTVGADGAPENEVSLDTLDNNGNSTDSTQLLWNNFTSTISSIGPAIGLGTLLAAILGFYLNKLTKQREQLYEMTKQKMDTVSKSLPLFQQLGAYYGEFGESLKENINDNKILDFHRLLYCFANIIYLERVILEKYGGIQLDTTEAEMVVAELEIKRKTIDFMDIHRLQQIYERNPSYHTFCRYIIKEQQLIKVFSNYFTNVRNSDYELTHRPDDKNDKPVYKKCLWYRNILVVELNNLYSLWYNGPPLYVINNYILNDKELCEYLNNKHKDYYKKIKKLKKYSSRLFRWYYSYK